MASRDKPDEARVRVFQSAREFVLEDLERLLYVSDSPTDHGEDASSPSWQKFLATPEGFVRGGGYLCLRGMDFGYRWRHDDYDDLTIHRPGGWRVSWNQITTELYAENRKHDKVWLIGRLPRGVDSTSVMMWFLKVESRQEEVNSLGIALDFYAKDEARGFQALRAANR